MLVEMGIDKPSQRHERQIMAIDWMSDQKRIAGRRFDRPEIVELDDEGVVPEERRAGNLGAIMEAERRARIACRRARGPFEVPGEGAILDFDVGHERNEKAVGHRVDERRTLLDRELLRLHVAEYRAR